MKRIIISTLFTVISVSLFSQENINNSTKTKDLAVPNSPAFMLMDVSPTLIQTPNTPKTFIFSIAQSFQESAGGFPQNYSAEFTPYWWFDSPNRNIYSMLALKTVKDDKNTVTSVTGENVFSGLRFTTFSFGFFNNDVIPDTLNTSQKIISAGARTTVVKIHQKKYSESIYKKTCDWHKLAQEEFDNYLYQQLARAQDKTEEDEIRKKILSEEFNPSKTKEINEEINELMNQKPLFSWDMAAAYATYGIGDSVWKTGRYGIWTTASSYLPLDLGGKKPNRNYFNINVIFRYIVDNYSLEDGIIGTTRNLDFGAKIALIFNALSIGVESEYRYLNFTPDYQNRTVGIINYKISDNLYLSGAFGKNFSTPNKLVAFLGINWGIGSESVCLPDSK